jgi:two-component sensor histidine kinase/PAS domain-containing protein
MKVCAKQARSFYRGVWILALLIACLLVHTFAFAAACDPEATLQYAEDFKIPQGASCTLKAGSSDFIMYLNYTENWGLDYIPKIEYYKNSEKLDLPTIKMWITPLEKGEAITFKNKDIKPHKFYYFFGNFWVFYIYAASFVIALMGVVVTSSFLYSSRNQKFIFDVFVALTIAIYYVAQISTFRLNYILYAMVIGGYAALMLSKTSLRKAYYLLAGTSIICLSWFLVFPHLSYPTNLIISYHSFIYAIVVGLLSYQGFRRGRNRSFYLISLFSLLWIIYTSIIARYLIFISLTGQVIYVGYNAIRLIYFSVVNEQSAKKLAEQVNIANRKLNDLNATLENKVFERTSHLTAVKDNTPDGIASICEDGYMTDSNPLMNTIFGKKYINIFDVFMDSNLSDDEIAIARAAIGCLIHFPDSAFLMNRHCLPAEILINARVIALRWGRITDKEDNITSLLISCSDETARRASELLAAQKTLEATIITELITLEDRPFLELSISNMQDSINKALSPDLGGEDQAKAIHTIKGTARSCGLLSLAEMAHNAENTNFRQQAFDRDELMQLRSKIDFYRATYNRIFANHDLSLIEKLLDMYPHLAAEVGYDYCSVIKKSIEPSIASAGRDAGLTIRLIVTGDKKKSLLTMNQKKAIAAASTHIARNSADHALRSVADPIIYVTVGEDNGFILLVLKDNGDGLNIRSLAQKIGTDNPSVIKERLLKGGISSTDKVTVLSGRGVGIASAYEAITQVGGNFDIRLGPQKNNGNLEIETVITLPIEASAKKNSYFIEDISSGLKIS